MYLIILAGPGEPQGSVFAEVLTPVLDSIHHLSHALLLVELITSRQVACLIVTD